MTNKDLYNLLVSQKADTDARFDGLQAKLVGHDEKFDGLQAKLVDHDEKFDGVQAKLVDHDEKFDGLQAKLVDHDEKFDGINLRFDLVDKKFADIQTQFVLQDVKLDGLYEAIISVKNAAEEHSRQMDARFKRVDTRFDDVFAKLDHRDKQDSRLETRVEAVEGKVAALSRDGHDSEK